jgi:hypothetical protein
MTITEQMKRIGGRCFDVALGVFLIATFAMVWSTSRTRAESGKGADAAGAKEMGGSGGASGVNAIVPLSGTICLVDDSSRNQIQFDSSGSYTFTDCAGGSLSGMGIFATKGSTITLTDVRGDRRLHLILDNSVNRATLGLQVFSPQRLFTITDRNTTNDVCGCPP